MVPGNNTIDIRVINGVLLTINERSEIFEEGEVHILGDRISYVGAELNGPVEAAKTINADGGIIMPGMINTHTHIGMSLLSLIHI